MVKLFPGEDFETAIRRLWTEVRVRAGVDEGGPVAHLARWIGRMAIDELACETADENAVTRTVRRLADQHELVVVDAAGVLSLAGR